jgi:hypothetical protein
MTNVYVNPSEASLRARKALSEAVEIEEGARRAHHQSGSVETESALSDAIIARKTAATEFVDQVTADACKAEASRMLSNPRVMRMYRIVCFIQFVGSLYLLAALSGAAWRFNALNESANTAICLGGLLFVLFTLAVHLIGGRHHE